MPCDFHVPETGPHRVYGAPPADRTDEQKVWEFPDCPINHIDGPTWDWLQMYVVLDEWGKAPADMGIPHHRVDPRYWDAMNTLRAEYNKLGREVRERARRRANTKTNTHNYPGF